MDQIKWCLDQKSGIELVEPNDNLYKAYLHKAQEALETMQTIKSPEWQYSSAYYTIYHSLYALMMKIGIKCEIHKCTLEFARRFLQDSFSKADFDLIDKAFTARIDTQYYTDRTVPDDNRNLILTSTPRFYVKCKNVILDESQIKKIRNSLMENS